MKPKLVTAVCPVCHQSVAGVLFDGGDHPLATLGWPATVEEARAMPRYPLSFVQCPRCSHVWNQAFTYQAIPYQDNPNRMFNQGGIWKGHLAETRDLLLRYLPQTPCVVDIGCGEGHFVRGVSASLNGEGRFVGIDPNATRESGRGVEFHARYFQPLVDMECFRPDAVVIRHVLEHLTDPVVLLEQLAWGAVSLDKPVLLFAEVPCIDRVFETKRLADFFYEHPSHFTTQSFRTLMEKAGEVLEFSHGYDGEVIYALVKLYVPELCRSRSLLTATFEQQSQKSRETIRAQLDEIAVSGRRVAIWGGTGKAAAFIHQFGVDAERFPLVVDSDPDKVGTYVPETAQQIVFRDELKHMIVDIVIIPTQWRAKDIVAEMQREGISASSVLIEHNGRLVDFLRDPHPYR